IIYPEDVHEMGRVIGEIKSFSGRRILKEWRARDYKILKRMTHNSGQTTFWQRRCYDHNCRTVEAVRQKIEYCHGNPVRARLVKEPGDWDWSSYNWYQGRRNVPLEIDEIEI
ncbi:MAG: hypothetical protein ABIE07_04970, partial [Candidatus Zixiibacteriota bacterium]